MGKGIDLSQNFLVKNIVAWNVKPKTFLDCFEENTKRFITHISNLSYTNIKTCERDFVPVEFCPITFCTHRTFYEKIFPSCFDWSPIGGFPPRTLPLPQRFEITLEDVTRMMNKNKQPNVSFVKINLALDKTIIKTYAKIKTQIFDTSFLMELFSKIFELCFIELEKQKSDLNPENIFKVFLRPCVIPNINLFLKYDTNV